MIELRFPLRDVLAVAEHAIAALNHKPTYANTVDGTVPASALWLVGDDGIYLMSNGLPEQPHPDGGDRLLVVFADGYTTAMSKHDVTEEIGGDDFCDAMPLLDTQTAGVTLRAQLTAGVAFGRDLFVIHLDSTSIQFFVADAPEATR
jgi:hypothetical protein